VQVGELDAVGIDDADGADTRRCQGGEHRGAEAAGADHQYPGGREAALAEVADLLERHLAGVPLALGRGEGRAR